MLQARGRVTMLLISILVPWLSVVAANTTCPMQDIAVQPNFDLDGFLGKWFELSWIPENWFPPEYNFQDFVVLYEQSNDTFVRADSYGRNSASSEDCFHGQDGLVLTDTPGKFMYDRVKNATTKERFQSDYWVIDTDYDQYALVFGCRGRDEQNVCVLPDGWLWARDTQISEGLQAHVEAKMTEICLRPAQFMVTQHNHPCPLTGIGPVHRADAGILSATMMTLIIFVKN